MTGRAAELTLISALALVLTLVIAAPVLRAPSDRIFGREIVGRHHDPFTVMEQFARPLTLGVYSQPLTDIPGALLSRVLGPVAVYNSIILLTFPLSAATAYLLARYLTLSPAGAAIAALAFAFSPFHLAHAAYHPHIAQTQWIPLYFLALWRCLDNSTPAAAGFLAVSVVGVTLSNFYGGLIAGVITPVAIAAYWFFMSRRRPHASRHLGITIASLTAIAVVAIPYAWHRLPSVFTSTTLAFPRDDLFKYSAKWWSYLVPPVVHPLFGRLATGIWNAAGVHEGLLEQQVSLGWGLVMLSVVAVAAWLLRGRSQPARATVPTLALVALVALVCSLSPQRTIGSWTFMRPSALLYLVVPMFRSYARFGVVVQLMTALLAAIGAERLWRGGGVARIACVGMLMLALGEYAAWPPSLWRDVLPTPAHRWVARQSDVQALDCSPLDTESESVQWLTGGRVRMLVGAFDDCLEPNLSDKLSARGYTHLLVRHDTEEARWFAHTPLPAGLRMQERFPFADLFVVTTTPAPTVYTAMLTGFSPREHDGTLTWRWMGADGVWNITNRGAGPVATALDIELWAFSRARLLDLRIDGHSLPPLVVDPQRHTYRIGPVTLTPGDHALIFHAAEPPTVADDVAKNGDRRPLSFAVGNWRWSIEAARP